MGNKPLVSVIIPVYNGEDFVAEAIGTVLAQDYPAIELILVDDGSHDNSLAIIDRYKDQVTLYTKENGGVASARNVGVEKAKGVYLAFLDQDDLWTSNKISAQVSYMEQHPDVDYVCSKFKQQLTAGTVVPGWVKPELLEVPLAGYIFGCLLIKARSFSKMGVLDSSLRYADDTDWFFKAKDLGLAMAHLPDTHVHKRVHGENASANINTIHKELLSVARRSIGRQHVA